MTSSVPPIYITSDFNNAFFPSSTNLTSSYLSSKCNYLLRKTTPDTATALESFIISTALVYGLTTNYINPVNISGGTMNIYTTTTTNPVNIYANTTTGNINYLTSGNIYLGNVNATTGVTNIRSQSYVYYPLKVISSVVPTSSHIGYITVKTVSKISTSSTSVAGTYTLYISNTALSYGKYLVSMTCSLTNAAITSGSITTIDYGYTYGSSGTASSNPKISQYLNNVTINPSVASDTIFSFSCILNQNNATTQYIGGYCTYTQTTMVGSTLININNFSIIRIG